MYSMEELANDFRKLGQVVENLLGTAEGRLGVDDPVFLGKMPEEVAEGAR